MLERYWIWASNFIKGDFGESFEFERPVTEIIGQRLGMSAILALSTITLTWMLAIPIGVYSATHQYSLGDQIFTTISFIGLGMPGFLLALIVLFFAMTVLGQEVGGLFSREFQEAPWSWAKFVDLLKHLWIPAFIGGILFSFKPLLYIGIVAYFFAVAFSVVTLPVEFDASKRALRTLETSGYLVGEELEGARKVLKAAAMTYVAAMLVSVINLLRLLLLARSRD